MILKTDFFEGPFDLLLHLIRKNEINIYDIPISELTDQYISYIESMFHEMNSMSEFILMAATLLEIKSKMLIPRPVAEISDTDGEDPRGELVRKLVEYKRIKAAADELKVYEVFAEDFFYKEPDRELLDDLKKVKPPVSELLSGVDTELLSAIFDDVISRKIPLNSVEERISEVLKGAVYSVQKKMTEITNMLHLRKEATLTAIFGGCENRAEKIAVFLAVLELVKLNEIFLWDIAGRNDFVCGVNALR